VRPGGHPLPGDRGGPVYTALGTELVDIFRLDANGKVVEPWDVGAATSANGNPEV
jgi:hypothetical protein